MTAAATSSLWRVLAASVIGSGHLEREEPCQDAHAVAVTDEGLLVLAVADGAGSAPRSAEGARAAVNAAVSYVMLSAQLGSEEGTAGEEGDLSLVELLAEAVRCASDTVFEVAGDEDPKDFATTLSLVVVDACAGELAAAQVGDGAVVLRRGEDLGLVGPVDRGEFLNETCFLTSSAWEDELRVDTAAVAGVDGVAVLTDGLQMLALDMSEGAPHPGFFRPIFEWASGDAGSDDELAGFLGSERVCARTDDDKTLVVAVPAPVGD